VQILTLKETKLHIRFNKCLVINKYVRDLILWNFSCHYLRKLSNSHVVLFGCSLPIKKTKEISPKI
jgi:hypothetical protein